MTIGGTPFTSSDEKLTLDVGNVTIGKGATLTNQNKGYQVGQGTEEQADGDVAGEEEPASSQTLVQFGTVTVNGGQFMDEAGARSNGENLVIESVADEKKAVEIKGTSVWDTLQIKKVESGAKVLNDYVTVTGGSETQKGGDFRVTGTFDIDAFADGSTFTLTGEDGSKVFADGVNLEFGSHVSADAFKSVEDTSEDNSAGYKLEWTEDGKHGVGTVKLADFDAVFTEVSETPEAPEGQAESDEDQTETAGSWTNKKFGNVTAFNSNVEISGSRAADDDVTKNGYMPSIEMSSLSLIGSSMKIAYDVEVGSIKP